MSRAGYKLRPGIRTMFRNSAQQPFLERFWVAVKQGEPNQCWPWLRGVSGNRYGVFGDGQNYTYAHRLAWELTNALPIPPDRFACHHCDNPICCNPSHIFVGTRIDNAQDAVAKGRACRGEKNGRSRLNEAQVRQIRLRLLSGATQASVAREFGTTQTTVGRIFRGELWTHVTDKLKSAGGGR